MLLTSSRRNKSRNVRNRQRKRRDGRQATRAPVPDRERQAAELVARAVEQHRAGHLDRAERGYARALDLCPTMPDALNLLGMLRLDAGDAGAATELFQRAVAHSPDVAAYQLNLGNARRAQRHLEPARDAYRRATELDPGLLGAWVNLGVVHNDLNRTADAVAAFTRALAIDPDYLPARHLLAALTGEHRDSAPMAYVIALFDDAAETFDELLAGLQYRVPWHLRALLDELPGAGRGDWTVIDIGCGTGLCGPLFRDVAGTLIGCDLSEGMLIKADARAVYDQLLLAPLVELLRARDSDVDLVVAADVFIYVGALEAAFDAACRALCPGGLLLFSVERTDGDHFALRPSGRFAHADAYIARLATERNFRVLRAQPTTIRIENSAPIAGQLYALQRGE